MKTTVNFDMFAQAFKQTRPDNFSHNGLCALFDYLEEYETDTGEEYEFDLIELCCNFTEYDDILQAAAENSSQTFENIDDALEYLRDHTQVIEVNPGIIIQNF